MTGLKARLYTMNTGVPPTTPNRAWRFGMKGKSCGPARNSASSKVLPKTLTDINSSVWKEGQSVFYGRSHLHAA